MAVVEPFRCNAEGFKRWLDDNPDGYVLNCYATGKVHSARCPSYQVAARRMTSYVKACSTSKRELFRHVKQQRIEAARCARELSWAGP
jgi:hypothetical protein